MLKTRLGVFICCAAWFAAPAYAAQGDTFTPYVDYSFTHDSNVFRLDNDQEALAVLGTTTKSDNIQRIKLGIDVDYALSRQHFIVQANVNRNTYNRFSDLNFTGREILTRWDWQVGNQWSGDIGYSNVLSLGSYAQLQQLIANQVTQELLFFNGGYLFHPSWRIRAGASGYQVDYDANIQRIFNRKEATGLVGLQYLSAAGNIAELQVKNIDAEYPNRQEAIGPVFDDKYDQTELNALVEYALTFKTKFVGRLGYVHRGYNRDFVENYNDVNGRLTVDWAATAKTRLTASIFRELQSIDDIQSNYLVATGVSFGPNWLPTSKIIVQGLLYYENRDYQGAPASTLGGADRQEDNVRGIALGVTYDPIRLIRLGVGYVVESRNSNRAFEGYYFNAVTATVRAQF